MIGTWLAGKVSGMIIFCIAAFGVFVLLPVVIAQHVKINGLHVPVVGWTLATGLNDEIATLKDRIENPKTGYIVRLGLADLNTSICKGELGKQNAATAAAEARGAQWLALANTAIRAAQGQSNNLRATADAILKSPMLVPGDACKSAFQRNREAAGAK